MPKVVTPYPLYPGVPNEFSMPRGTKILGIKVLPEMLPGQVARTVVERPVMYGLGEVSGDGGSTPTVYRRFVAYQTGQALEEGKRAHYVDTYTLNEGQYVYHVFEEEVGINDGT